MVEYHDVQTVLKIAYPAKITLKHALNAWKVFSLRMVSVSCVKLLVGVWSAKGYQCAGNVGQDKLRLAIDAVIAYNNVLLAFSTLFRCVRPATKWYLVSFLAIMEDVILAMKLNAEIVIAEILAYALIATMVIISREMPANLASPTVLNVTKKVARNVN